MNDLDLLILGDYFCDFILTGLPEVPRLGADLFGQDLDICPGGAFIFAAAITRLGVRAAWRAELGNDFLSRFMAEEIRRHGLDERLIERYEFPLRRLSISFSFTTDRGFISYADPHPGWQVPFALIEQHRPAWVTNLPFGGTDEDVAAIRKIHALGSKIFTDCQYIDFDLSRPGVLETLAVVDIFAPNESEAMRLTGAPDAETALDTLADIVPLVVIKRGAKGVIARQGSRRWQAPAYPLEVVDTTGAGDCFNAGFLAALIAGHPLETCLQWGNVCGGLSTTRRGGVSAAPTLAELHAFLAEHQHDQYPPSSNDRSGL